MSGFIFCIVLQIGQFNHQTVVRTLLEQISDGQIQWAPLGTSENLFDTIFLACLQ